MKDATDEKQLNKEIGEAKAKQWRWFTPSTLGANVLRTES